MSSDYHLITIWSAQQRAQGWLGGAVGTRQQPLSSGLSEASVELMQPRDSISTLHKLHFSTEHGPNQTFAANSYLQLYQLQLPTKYLNFSQVSKVWTRPVFKPPHE